MKSRTLLPHPDYSPESQRLLGYWAAQLDNQTRVLELVVDGLGAAELEWQPAPGHNSIGMLLAHLAIVEVWWLQVVVDGSTQHTDADAAVRGILGIGMHDDGMPLAADGRHPGPLEGLGLDAYLALIVKARQATHRRLRSWLDGDLGETAVVEETEVSRAWIVYHVLEHLSCHLGQIRLKRRQLRESST